MAACHRMLRKAHCEVFMAAIVSLMGGDLRTLKSLEGRTVYEVTRLQ